MTDTREHSLNLIVLQDLIREQKAEIERLTAALKEYGQHKAYGDIPCRKSPWDFEVPCVCGLDEILAG